MKNLSESGFGPNTNHFERTGVIREALGSPTPRILDVDAISKQEIHVLRLDHSNLPKWNLVGY